MSDNARFLIALIKSKKQEEVKQDILNEIANEHSMIKTKQYMKKKQKQKC